MTSRVQIIVRCEDAEHRKFIVGVLRHLGHTKVDAVIVGNFDEVRKAFKKELAIVRTRLHRTPNHGLVVVCDADVGSVAERRRWLCEDVGELERDEPVVLVIPRRNIETWILRLNGDAVAEVDENGATIDLCGTPRARRALELAPAAALAFFRRIGTPVADRSVPSIGLSTVEFTRLPHHSGED